MFCNILYDNNNVIGVYYDDNLMNLEINGLVQKKFIKRNQIKIEKYTANSLYCHDQENNKDIIIDIKPNNNLDNNINLDIKTNNNLDNNLLKSEEYIKIQQEKIDTKHKINELKNQKKKFLEEKQQYDYDLTLYYQLKKEEINEIPEIFALKYNIFEKLEENINFNNFMEEYKKVKPDNNYNLFSSNVYDDDFIKNNKHDEIILDI
jgi:hypothetical protein